MVLGHILGASSLWAKHHYYEQLFVHSTHYACGLCECRQLSEDFPFKVWISPLLKREQQAEDTTQFASNGTKMHTCISSKRVSVWHNNGSLLGNCFISIPWRTKSSGTSLANMMVCYAEQGKYVYSRKNANEQKKKHAVIQGLVASLRLLTRRRRSWTKAFNWNIFCKTVMIIIITMPRIYSENNERLNKLSKEIFAALLHYSHGAAQWKG